MDRDVPAARSLSPRRSQPKIVRSTSREAREASLGSAFVQTSNTGLTAFRHSRVPIAQIQAGPRIAKRWSNQMNRPLALLLVLLLCGHALADASGSPLDRTGLTKADLHKRILGAKRRIGVGTFLLVYGTVIAIACGYGSVEMMKTRRYEYDGMGLAFFTGIEAGAALHVGGILLGEGARDLGDLERAHGVVNVMETRF